MRHHLLTTGLITTGIASIAASAALAQTVPSQPPTAAGLANGAPPPASTIPAPTPTPAPTAQPAPATQTAPAPQAQSSGQTGYSEQKSVSPPWNAPYQRTRIHPVVKAHEVHDMTPSRNVDGQSASTYTQSATNPATPRTRVVVSGRTY
jgi:hypothetical protein